jgi:staphyloferrin B biosynthesis citrate synthase
MTGPELNKKLRRGEALFGTLIVSPSPRWPQVVAGSGLDFVFIDTEHIAIDRHQLSWMCQTYAALGLPPIVRIPSPDPYEATKILDGGAMGLVAPYIESVEQVKALRGAVKLRPLKGAKLSGLLAGGSCEPELEQYVERHCAANTLIVNIESVPGIAALDDILAVPGLDGVLIGPHDLSCSLGVPEQYGHPKFLEAVGIIFRKARAAGLGAGIHWWGTAEEQARFLEMGANLIIHSADLTLFQKHIRLELDAIKKAAGIHAAQTGSNADII